MESPNMGHKAYPVRLLVIQMHAHVIAVKNKMPRYRLILKCDPDARRRAVTAPIVTMIIIAAMLVVTARTLKTELIAAEL